MELRTYQQQCVEKALAAFHKGENFLVILPTGAGKTITCKEIVRQIGRPTLFLAHTSLLVEQARQVLGELASCATIQSEIRKEVREEVEVVVIDEAHHSLATSYQSLLYRYPSAFFLGLTATPSRAGLMDIFPAYYQVYIQDLIAQKYLCAIESIAFTGEKAPDVMRSTAGDFNLKDLSKLCNCEERNDRVASLYAANFLERKTIAFCVDKNHCKAMHNSFTKVQVKSIVITGDNSKEEQQWIIDSFKRGSTQVLLTVQLLTEGVDIPCCDCVLNLSPTKSKIAFAQRVGRMLRLYEGKKEALFLDFVYDGNSLAEAATICDYPCKKIKLLKMEKEGDKSRPVRLREVNPLDLINGSYNIFAIQNPPFLVPIPNESDKALIACKSQKTAFNTWANCFCLVTFPNEQALSFCLQTYLHDYRNKTLSYFPIIQSPTLFQAFDEASKRTGVLVDLDRKEALRLKRNATLLSMKELMKKFFLTPSGQAFEDYCSLFLRKAQIAFKSPFKREIPFYR